MKNEDTSNLLNYPPIVNELQSWKGTGNLSWPNHSVTGDFVLSRLLNGKLRFVFKPQDWINSSKFKNRHDLEFDGVADEYSISARGIHFTRGFLDELPGIWVGFAQSATRRIDVDANTVSVRCDLTNYSLNRPDKIDLQLDGFAINITRLGWGTNKDNGIKEHATAYRHAYLSSCLTIENIPLSKTDQAIDCLDEVAALLSIACRGHAHIAARHIWNYEKGKFDSLYEEPPFPVIKWLSPLISSENIKDFLMAAYPMQRDRVQKLELAFITDHYLQALTLRLVWPISVGIFTAMDSLVTVFFNQNMDEENESYQYWVVSPEKFESNKKMVKEVIEVFANHFSRFKNLLPSETDSLKLEFGFLRSNK
jgi:hypothetical protein